MTRALDRLGPRGHALRIAAASAVVVAPLAWGVLEGHDAHVVAALAASWIFFAGATAGALALSALLELAGARWCGPFHPIAARLARYLPFAAGSLVVLAVLGADARGLHGGAASFFVAREVLAGVALVVVGGLTVRGDPGEPRPTGLLVTYCVVFAFVGSLWAYDFVVLPSPGFQSTLAGPHLFVGAFVSGLGLVVIGALRAGSLDLARRRDAATLLIALSIFWAYLFWSQVLTLWFGNLPDETAFLARRGAGGWSVVALVVVGATLVVPVVLLITARGKASGRVLLVAAASQLAGLWLERQLLVVPAVGGPSATPVDVPGLLIQLGMALVFVLCTWPWGTRGPAVAPAHHPTGAAAPDHG